ncbi:hypothetical protein QQF64_020458 [Cirrhinus molitorella]|uniref:Uncharacterized protein n=1 Tax=Cirrhinus molitorella TaxID=172907 RepID=A0ABR3LD59_9TELE
MCKNSASGQPPSPASAALPPTSSISSTTSIPSISSTTSISTSITTISSANPISSISSTTSIPRISSTTSIPSIIVNEKSMCPAAIWHAYSQEVVVQLFQTFPLTSQAQQLLAHEQDLLIPESDMEDMEVTLAESDVMEITPTPGISDSAVMKNIQLACKWVQENQHHFAGKIELPKVLRMKEEDALLPITIRDLFMNTTFYEGERDEEQIRAPFLFTFQRGYNILEAPLGLTLRRAVVTYLADGS